MYDDEGAWSDRHDSGGGEHVAEQELRLIPYMI